MQIYPVAVQNRAPSSPAFGSQQNQSRIPNQLIQDTITQVKPERALKYGYENGRALGSLGLTEEGKLIVHFSHFPHPEMARALQSALKILKDAGLNGFPMAPFKLNVTIDITSGDITPFLDPFLLRDLDPDLISKEDYAKATQAFMQNLVSGRYKIGTPWNPPAQS